MALILILTGILTLTVFVNRVIANATMDVIPDKTTSIAVGGYLASILIYFIPEISTIISLVLCSSLSVISILFNILLKKKVKSKLNDRGLSFYIELVLAPVALTIVVGICLYSASIFLTQ